MASKIPVTLDLPCDACGRGIPEPDEILCPKCKAVPCLEVCGQLRAYDAVFCGRHRGAIGFSYRIQTIVYGANPEQARLALYDRFDHISGLVLCEIGEK